MASGVIFEPRFPSILSTNLKQGSARLHTKVICTVTPPISSVDALLTLIDAGMNVARLNLAFSDRRYHYQTLLNIKEANRLRPNSPCGVIVDLKGSILRTGKFRGAHGVTLIAGQEFTIVPDSQVEGDSSSVSCAYEHLGKAVKPGMIVHLDHGKLTCEVQGVDEGGIHMIVKVGGYLGGARTITIPGAQVKMPVITDKDEDDLVNFILKHNIDYVAISGAKAKKDIERVREILGDKGAHLKVLVKIQNADILNNFEGILEACDGVVITRKDMAIEIASEKVFLAQKAIADRCAASGKIAIISTEILEAREDMGDLLHASGIINSVRDGIDAFQLSEETSIGSDPEVAIHHLVTMLEEGEELFAYESREQRALKSAPLDLGSLEATCHMAMQTAVTISAKLFIVITDTGYSAIQLSKYRLGIHILCASTISATLTQLSLVRSCLSMRLDDGILLEAKMVAALNYAKESALVGPRDKVVVVACESEMESKSGMLRVISID